MGLFDRFRKTSAEREAAKEAENRRKLVEEIMNSPEAQDVNKRFEEGVGGTYSEPKERGGHIVWRPKSSEAGSHTIHQEPDKSGGLGDGAPSSETAQAASSTSRAKAAVDTAVSGKLGEGHDHEAEGGGNQGIGDEKRG